MSAAVYMLSDEETALTQGVDVDAKDEINVPIALSAFRDKEMDVEREGPS